MRGERRSVDLHGISSVNTPCDNHCLPRLIESIFSHLGAPKLLLINSKEACPSEPCPFQLSTGMLQYRDTPKSDLRPRSLSAAHQGRCVMHRNIETPSTHHPPKSDP